MFGGMGNMGNMQGMMKKVQKLQNDMKKMQEELKKKTVEVSAGGGAAFNESVKKVDDMMAGEMGKLTGGLGLPPGMF